MVKILAQLVPAKIIGAFHKIASILLYNSKLGFLENIMQVNATWCV